MPETATPIDVPVVSARPGPSSAPPHTREVSRVSAVPDARPNAQVCVVLSYRPSDQTSNKAETTAIGRARLDISPLLVSKTKANTLVVVNGVEVLNAKVDLKAPNKGHQKRP